jgi:hypothetical protein
MDTIEGGSPSKLVQIIRKYGANTDTRIEFGTITAVSPLRVQVDGMKIELEADDLVIAEHLTEHTRNVDMSGGSASGAVSPDGSLTSFAVTDAALTIKSALEVGARVIVAEINSGQTYVILDRMGAA